jgi:hypothetical protein
LFSLIFNPLQLLRSSGKLLGTPSKEQFFTLLHLNLMG